ncbi:MAG TPA: ABC transporter permease [Nitrospiria bacterium]|nr:ABC transporter permease [Nitrospiria bacterium]HUK56487.1 ABC transporter permease [Nitrospiria bacterium]
MIRFILGRLAWGVPVLWLVATATFILMHVVPGGPFDQEKSLPPEIRANVDAKYHLDRPVLTQYVLYLGDLLRGNLGPSYKYLGRNVDDIIRDTLPVSAQLGLWAVLISVIAGVGAGIVAAARPRSWADHAGMFLATIGISVPNFVIGTFLIMIFSYRLHLFPAALWEGWRYSVLPAVTLALLPAAYIARLTRSSMLEILDKEFIRTVRANGFGEGRVLLKHALKNSITPVVSFLGPLTATLVTGSFVVEFIFSVPGMGRYFITAVTNRDYPLIMGVTLVYAVLIVAANIVVDLAYMWLDPRMRIKDQ